VAEPQTTWTKDELWAELAVLGEEKVREFFVVGRYGDVGEKRALVESWLRAKEDERKEASQSRQAEAASRAAAGRPAPSPAKPTRRSKHF
jgi:hypothetical protein